MTLNDKTFARNVQFSFFIISGSKSLYLMCIVLRWIVKEPGRKLVVMYDVFSAGVQTESQIIALLNPQHLRV